MSLREKLEKALKKARISDDYLNKWLSMISASSQDLIASPGLISLEVGLYFVEDEDIYASFWRRLLAGFKGKEPTKMEPVTRLLSIVNKDILEFGCCDIYWDYGVGSGLFIQRSVDFDVAFAQDEDNLDLTNRQIFDRTKAPGEVHLLTLTTSDLTRSEYEESKLHLRELLVDEKSPKDMEWWNSLLVPQLAD